jgi:hypothetical protein
MTERRRKQISARGRGMGFAEVAANPEYRVWSIEYRGNLEAEGAF